MKAVISSWVSEQTSKYPLLVEKGENMDVRIEIIEICRYACPVHVSIKTDSKMAALAMACHHISVLRV
jgi:hypothetical protein